MLTLATLLLLTLSCFSPAGKQRGPDTDDTDHDTDDTDDTDDTQQDTSDTDVGDDCHATAAAEDRLRKVVISHPYDSSGAQSDQFEVLELSQTGELSRINTYFALGRAFLGDIVFTPDGEIGIAVHDDGTLGVFRFDGDDVVVIHTDFGANDFYASRVTMDPSGSFFWVVDDNWRNNGGGLYRVSLDCDGNLTDEGLVVEGKQPAAALLDPSDTTQILVPSRDLLDSPTGDNLHLIDVDTPQLLSSEAIFPDDEASVSHAIWHNEYAFVSDNSFFSSTPNRIAVARVTNQTIEALQIIDGIEDPVWLVPSPFDNSVLVTSGFGDGLYVIKQQGVDSFYLEGELSYASGAPELPAAAVAIERGSQRGLVLVAETSGIRQVRFDAQGTTTDEGRFYLGSGYANIVGAIGVQP